jgi:hypothetical protein
LLLYFREPTRSVDEWLASTFSTLWIIALVVGTLLLGLAKAGFQFGLRLHAKKDEARMSQIGGVQAAVLGLLGLLLGFTFAMAVNRYETKRQLVVKEANAIGTTFLRVDLLPESHQPPTRELLRQYLDIRIQYEPLASDPQKLAQAVRLSAEVENNLWKHAGAAAREAPTPATIAFVNALNQMIDIDAERVANARSRIPGGVWLLLLVVAGFGCFTSAYGGGTHGSRSAFTSFLLPILITVVIMQIFDLMHVRQGLAGISQEPMLQLRESIGEAARHGMD